MTSAESYRINLSIDKKEHRIKRHAVQNRSGRRNASLDLRPAQVNFFCDSLNGYLKLQR